MLWVTTELAGDPVAGARRTPCWMVLAHRMVLRRSSWSKVPSPSPRSEGDAERGVRRAARALSSLLTFLKTFHSRNRLSYMRLLSRESVRAIKVMVRGLSKT